MGRINKGKNLIIFLFLAKNANGKTAMYPQTVPKRFRNLNALAVINVCEFFSMAEHPTVGQDRLLYEALRLRLLVV